MISVQDFIKLINNAERYGHKISKLPIKGFRTSTLYHSKSTCAKEAATKGGCDEFDFLAIYEKFCPDCFSQLQFGNIGLNTFRVLLSALAERSQMKIISASPPIAEIANSAEESMRIIESDLNPRINAARDSLPQSVCEWATEISVWREDLLSECRALWEANNFLLLKRMAAQALAGGELFSQLGKETNLNVELLLKNDDWALYRPSLSPWGPVAQGLQWICMNVFSAQANDFQQVIMVPHLVGLSIEAGSKYPFDDQLFLLDQPISSVQLETLNALNSDERRATSLLLQLTDAL